MRWSILLAVLILAAVLLPQVRAGDAPAPAANAADTEVLRVYDLVDLMQAPTSTLSALALLNGPVSSEFTPGTPKSAAEQAPKLDEVLRSLFEPAIAELLSSKSILRSNTLFVTAGPALQRHVEQTLASTRRQRNLQISTHVTLFAMDPQHRQTRYALPSFHWQPLPGNAEAAIAELTPSEQSTLVDLLGGDKQVAVLTSPRMTAFSGQRASMTNIKQYAYASPVFTPKGPDLRNSVLTFGDAYEVRATPTADNTFIHLELTQMRVELLEIKTIPWEGLEDRLKPHIPVTSTSSIHVNQALANGHGLVVATGAFLLEKDQPRAGFLLIECTLLDEAARVRQVKAFHERKAELKAELEKAAAEAKAAQQKKSAPPVTKGADNF